MEKENTSRYSARLNSDYMQSVRGKEKLAAVTIIDSGYLIQSLVLAESFLKYHPDSLFYIFTIEFFPESLNVDDRIVFQRADSTGIPIPVWREMKKYYDIVELATSLKPWVLLKLLEIGHEIVSYVDPDMLCISSFDVAYEFALNNSVVITPHRINVESNHFPDEEELSLLQYGIFNCGFLACSSTAKGILNWWKIRMLFYANRSSYKHEFTDQKWVNYFPTMSGVVILRDYGYNFAVFNLKEREVEIRGNSIFVNNDKLCLIHFTQSFSTFKRESLSGKIGDFKIPKVSQLNSKLLFDELKSYYSSLISSKANTLTGHNYLPFENRYESRIYRHCLRKAALASYRGEKSKVKILHKMGFISSLMKPLERSHFFQYAVYGLYLDSKRLVKKIKFNSNQEKNG